MTPVRYRQGVSNVLEEEFAHHRRAGGAGHRGQHRRGPRADRRARADAFHSWTGTVGEDRFGDARFKVRGRFQYDIYSNDWDLSTEEGSRSYVRRAFLGVQGRFSEQWRYKVDFVLGSGASGASAGSNEDEVAVDDAYLEWVGDTLSIVIGEHNITSPLEDRISSLDIPFNERSSYINAFEFGRAAGVGVIIGGANWSASGALQGDSLNNQDNSFVGNEQFSASGRFTFAPIFETTPEGTRLLHLGVFARQREVARWGNVPISHAARSTAAAHATSILALSARWTPPMARKSRAMGAIRRASRILHADRRNARGR